MHRRVQYTYLIYTTPKILGYTPRPRFSPLTPLPLGPVPLSPSLLQLPFPSLLYRNPLILTKSQRQIHILQALRRSPLQQIINRSINDDPRAARMDTEASDLDTVFAGDVFHEWGLARDFDELFAGVPVLVEGADVAGGHGAGEGDGDGVLRAEVLVEVGWWGEGGWKEDG